MTASVSRTAEIRKVAREGDSKGAEAMLSALLADLFSIRPRGLAINHDQYSLNSLNGFFETDDGAFFFKFHQEEGEEAMSGEYYRADLLARAGLPVDQPVLMSVLPGEQILVYRRRSDPRFSDVLRALDLADEPEERARAVAAEKALNAEVLRVYQETLHPVSPAEVAAEPIHRLFFERLIDPPAGSFPGGRLARFYVGQSFAFPGLTLDWDRFSALHLCVNGILYRDSIGALFEAAKARLAPTMLTDAGGVTAHGDAHNANVWYERRGEAARLAFFDPAFAGDHVPSLLAEVKTTFHNILAHPLWLYDPTLASDRFLAEAALDGDILRVTTNHGLSPIRRDLLAAKADGLWRPLLASLKDRGLLPEDWRRVVRLALFLCPTLVMNLRAGAASHTPTSSLIAFSTAVMAGSEPVDGEDLMTRFFDAIDPNRG